jgi:hypothetical protein
MKTGFEARKGNFGIQFENGWSVSVAFYTDYHYCDHKKKPTHQKSNKRMYSKCKNAEVLIMDPQGKYLTNSEIEGYVTPEKLVSILQSIRSKPCLTKENESESENENNESESESEDNESESESEENESESESEDNESESESEENEEKSWCGIQ